LAVQVQYKHEDKKQECKWAGKLRYTTISCQQDSLSNCSVHKPCASKITSRRFMQGMCSLLLHSETSFHRQKKLNW